MTTPGDVVTARFPAGEGDRAVKARPAVVVARTAASVLVAPITDATRRRFPGDAELRDFPSGTQTKHARIACDRARSMEATDLEERAGARPLTRVERSRLRMAFRIAWGLAPGPAVTRDLPVARGQWVEVDGIVHLVVSFDGGNQYARSVTVVPLADGAGDDPGVQMRGGHLCLDRLTCVRWGQATPLDRAPLDETEQASVDRALLGLLAGL